jgi:hypothetical protein
MTALQAESLLVPLDVRAALMKLPVEAWPYGRVIAISDCSIVDSADQDRGERRTAVEAVLKTLGLQIERWPS